MMKKKFFSAILIVLSLNAYCTDTLSVCSPSGKICIKIWMKDELNFRVYENGLSILEPSKANLLLTDNGSFSDNNPIKSHSIKKVTNEIISPVPEKRKRIKDDYNLLSIVFRKPYKIEIRAYDDGVAYRFLTSFKDSITVQNEVASFHFPESSAAWFPSIHKRQDADIFHTSFEELYPLRQLVSIKNSEVGYSPVLVAGPSDPKIAIAESDLEDYPGMFLKGTGSDVLKAVFAGYPLEEKMTDGDYPQSLVIKRAGYIARTKGTRTFPWRILIIADEDKDLPSNDIVYRLASPSRIGDASWVKPGKGTDEWTINVNLFNVPFRSGVNTASYKYYIDFAKRFGFNRIMMDAGWSDNRDMFKINPDINMDTIVAYAKEKGIKISMWTLAHTLDRQLDSALNRFNKWGVDFIMTDFMDRSDQKMVNFYYRIAKACAEHHIMIMYHGAFPPKGFNRTYPNNITREGVLGSEYNIGSDLASPEHHIMIMYHGAFPPKGFNRTYPNNITREGVLGSEYNIGSNLASPEHDVTLPFTRMLEGSLDYEPGILNNATKKGFRPIEGMVMSQGTRCHQLAMFVVYDNPMEIFSGNPSQAWLEPKFTELLANIPTTWDETKIIDGKVGKYIITARKKGNEWFIGAMTNWAPRDLEIKLDFLDSMATYDATICKDGINADRYAADYILSDTSLQKNNGLKIHVAPGGGFVIKLVKK